jgi:hypothetical protein
VFLTIRFGTPNSQGLLKVIKKDISENMYEHNDFPTVEENVYRSSIAINHTLRARCGTGIGRCVEE